MLEVIDNWLGDKDLVRFLDRQFTYKTPHNYIEFANSYDAPTSIFGKNDSQDVDSHIFYSYDFNPGDPLIRFLVLKAMDDIEARTGHTKLNCLRVHLAIQHAGQDVERHNDGSDITAVYVASANGGGTFDFHVEEINDVWTEKVPFVNNKLILFDGKIKHEALAPQGKRPRILLVMKLGFSDNKSQGSLDASK